MRGGAHGALYGAHCARPRPPIPAEEWFVFLSLLWRELTPDDPRFFTIIIGVVTLTKAHTLCKEGEPLTPEQAKILVCCPDCC